MNSRQNEKTIEFRRRKHRGALSKAKLLLFIAVLSAAALSVLFSPIFAVNEVTITGIKKFSEEEINDIDSKLKAYDIASYLNNKVVYGISGKIKNINFNGIKSLEDLKKSLGEPTNTINDTAYWEIKDVDNTLYITYSNDYIEIMYK